MKETFLQQVQAHEKQIYKICHFYANNEADKQDLYQEILLQLWKSYPNFRGKSKFNTWLYRVAINTAIAGIRKEKKHIQAQHLTQLPEQMEEVNSCNAEEEKYSKMYIAIGQLNEIEKAVTVLFIDGKSYADIEEILGISESTLRVKMNRIKKKLSQLAKNI